MVVGVDYVIMKKRIFSLLLVAIMACFICACGGSDNTNSQEGSKKVVLSNEEFESYCEYIELTTENWNNYIEVVEEERILKDVFGEEVERETHISIRLKENCYISRDNAIRLTYTSVYGYVSTEDFIFAGSVGRAWGISGIDMEQEYVCEKIKGKICKVSVPEDKWNIDEYGNKYFCVQVSKGFMQTFDKYTVTFD